MKKIVLFFLCLIANTVSAQTIPFQKCFGSFSDDEANAHKELIDGSFLFAGSTYSFGAGSYDGYLVKTDPSGKLLWSKTYGTFYNESFNDVLLTADGGYLLAGYFSNDNNNSTALYLVKTDANGTEQWSKTYYDGNLHNVIRKVIATPDGGFLCVGKDQYYMPVIKIDATGNLVFSYQYDISGSGISWGESVILAPDGGFIITGHARNNSYLNDLILLKINPTGAIQWIKKYSHAAGSIYGNELLQLADGSLVVTGCSDAFGAGKMDAILLKTDEAGNLLWIHAYGGSEYEESLSLAKTCDGGFVLSGFSGSFRNGIEDLFLVKTNAMGTLEWSNIYGGLLYETGAQVTTNNNCELILSGTTSSYGSGGKDLFFLKLDPQGYDEQKCNINTAPAIQTTPLITVSGVGINLNAWSNQENAIDLVTSPVTVQSDSVCRTCLPPEADFDYVQNIMTVHFLNYSINGILYSWDFGDGHTDTDAAPVHKYAATGNYMARLITTNECNRDTILKNVSIVNTSYCLYNTQPGPSRGIDADVFSLTALKNQNRSLVNTITSDTWTWGGEEGTHRSLLKFNLEPICTLDNLVAAHISLFYPTGIALGGYLHSGPNDFSFYRVNQDWPLKSVTWNNQPTYTTANRLYIPVTPRYSSLLNTDVTALIKDMVTFGNYGFLTKLETEQTYRGAMYGASDWAIPSERPLLKLTFNPLITSVPFTDTTICRGDSLQLQASGGLRYKWFPSQGLSCTDCPNPKALPEKDTTYTVYIYNCENCAEIQQITIHYPPLLQIPNHQAYICKGDSVQLLATNVDRYQWSPSTGMNNDTLANPTVSPAQTGYYKVVGLSDEGCPFRDSINVRVDSPPDFKLDTSLCNGTTIQLDLSEKGGSYQWNDGSTHSYFTVSDTGIYWLELTNNCGITRDTLHVKTCCELLNVYSLFGQKILMHCFENGPLELSTIWGNTFSWHANSSSLSSLTVDEPGWYAVTAYNSVGCAVMDSLLVSDYCLPAIFVPSAFSPNGDGQNDFLEIFGHHFKNFEMKIFNRWGEIIYISKDRAVWWDGQYRETPMPVGTYPWTIQYESSFGEEGDTKTMKGSITLIR